MSGELITVVGLLAGTIVTCSTTLLIAQLRTHKQARQANKAVNDDQPGQLTIYGMVASMYSRHEKMDGIIVVMMARLKAHDQRMRAMEERQDGLTE